MSAKPLQVLLSFLCSVEGSGSAHCGPEHGCENGCVEIATANFHEGCEQTAKGDALDERVIACPLCTLSLRQVAIVRAQFVLRGIPRGYRSAELSGRRMTADVNHSAGAADHGSRPLLSLARAPEGR
jgi:hypothetical protein